MCLRKVYVHSFLLQTPSEEHQTKLDPTFEPYETSTDSTCTEIQMREPSDYKLNNSKNSTLFNKTMKQNGVVPGFVIRDPTIEAIRQQTEYVKSIEETYAQHKTEDDVNSEWRDLSNVLDRVFLILYLLITIITTLSFILQCLWQSCFIHASHITEFRKLRMFFEKLRQTTASVLCGRKKKNASLKMVAFVCALLYFA